jgi:NitT/TauT family transport system permease protein
MPTDASSDAVASCSPIVAGGELRTSDPSITHESSVATQALTTGAVEPLAAPARRRERVRWFELRTDIPPWVYRALVVLGFAGALSLWFALSANELVDPVFLPAPREVAGEALASLRDDNLWLDLRASFVRVTGGFFLAAVMGIPAGLAMGGFKTVEGLTQPLTEFVRYIPVPALIPILMVIFGIDELSKVMLIFVGTFFQLALMVADEVRRVPYELLQVSYTLGASRVQVVRLVLWRAAMPGIFDALRLCNGWAWTYLVVAELVAANEGMGFRILKFSRYLQTPKIWVYLILLGAIGLGLDLIFRRLNRRLFHWADTTQR